MLVEVDQQSSGQHLGEQHLEGGHPQQPGDYGAGAGKGGFAGGIWEHDEDDDKGWIFSVGGAGWPSGFQGRPGQWCTILIDSGSSATVCGPQHFPDYPIVPSERLALCGPSGKPLQHYGQKEVSFVAEDGQNVNIKFDVANVVRPIVSVGKLQQDGKEAVLGKESYIKECRGRRGVRRLGLFTIAALFFLRLQIAAGCATGPSMGKTTLGTKATDEVWAVEGPEVPSMQADDPEHQVDIFQSANEEVEGPEARGLPAPPEPTKAEVEWHNLTHVPPAPWCSVCVRGRGRDRRHEAQGAEARADSESWPYIQVDYFFMKYRDEEVAQPYLSAVDSKYGRCMAAKCVSKGSQDEYAVKALENFCRQLGAEKFFLQLDPEHSIQDVVGKVCAKVPGGMARTTPKLSKQSLGLAERFHGTVESDCRVLLLSALSSYKLELLPPSHPIFDWLVRHAAWVHERFRQSRHDGRSAFARHLLREYPSQVVPFGETVIFRDTGPIKSKLRSNWNFGIWLGRDSQDDMHIVGTRQGIVKARSVKRTIPSERYDQQLLLQMKGRPYDIKGDKVFESPPLAQPTSGTSASSSSAAPMASSGPTTATTPAASTGLPGKEDANHMDVDQQYAERCQDKTVEQSPEVPTTRPRGRPPVRMSVLPKSEDSKLNCSACAGKSYYHKVDCPRREEARQLKEAMKFLRQAEREEKAAKGASSGEGSEAKKAKLMEVEVTPESQATDEDMDPGHRGEDESPNKKQRVEHTVSHVTGDSEVEDLATNEEMET